MKQNIHNNKIIFSPNLKPGQVMQIETEDEKATGLLYENKEDYITVIVIKENYDEYGTITYAVENMKTMQGKWKTILSLCSKLIRN